MTIPPAADGEAAVPTPRDAAYWAKNVSTLRLGEVPAEAFNLNVTGKRVVGPVQGFGRMWQKTYRVELPGVDLSPAEVVAAWKSAFASFWPATGRFYGPLTGIAPGEVALLNISVGGGVKLSTGVLVLYADEESFTFMTPQGHMFAGWITFSADRRDEVSAGAGAAARQRPPVRAGHAACDPPAGGPLLAADARQPRRPSRRGATRGDHDRRLRRPAPPVGQRRQRVAQRGHPLGGLRARRAAAPARPATPAPPRGALTLELLAVVDGPEVRLDEHVQPPRPRACRARSRWSPAPVTGEAGPG